MQTVFIILAIGGLLTSVFAAYKTGQEQAHLKILAPQQLMSVNWVNCFFQGVLWPAYWAQYFSHRHTLATLPTDPQQAKEAAAWALGIPLEQVR